MCVSVCLTVERRRRDKINNWIVQLSKLVPECAQETVKQTQAVSIQLSSCFYHQGFFMLSVSLSMLLSSFLFVCLLVSLSSVCHVRHYYHDQKLVLESVRETTRHWLCFLSQSVNHHHCHYGIL